MGYSTEFTGSLKFNDGYISPELKDFINLFSQTRRMKRDPEKIKELYGNWRDYCFHLDLGQEGGYFVGGDGLMGQANEDSIVDYNKPPIGQPGLWCHWAINDNDELEWDGSEKFCNYVEWLEYLIEHFFNPFGYYLNGRIEFQGEDSWDAGYIIVKNNNVSVSHYSIDGIEEGDDDNEDLIPLF